MGLHYPRKKVNKLWATILSAMVLGSSGCHYGWMNTIREHHSFQSSQYYDCPHCGEVVSKAHFHDCQCRGTPGCYGFQSTCWRAWPQGCDTCPPPAQQNQPCDLPPIPYEIPVAPAQPAISQPSPEAIKTPPVQAEPISPKSIQPPMNVRPPILPDPVVPESPAPVGSATPPLPTTGYNVAPPTVTEPNYPAFIPAPTAAITPSTQTPSTQTPSTQAPSTAQPQVTIQPESEQFAEQPLNEQLFDADLSFPSNENAAPQTIAPQNLTPQPETSQPITAQPTAPQPLTQQLVAPPTNRVAERPRTQPAPAPTINPPKATTPKAAAEPFAAPQSALKSAVVKPTKPTATPAPKPTVAQTKPAQTKSAVAATQEPALIASRPQEPTKATEPFVNEWKLKSEQPKPQKSVLKAPAKTSPTLPSATLPTTTAPKTSDAPAIKPIPSPAPAEKLETKSAAPAETKTVLQQSPTKTTKPLAQPTFSNATLKLRVVDEPKLQAQPIEYVPAKQPEKSELELAPVVAPSQTTIKKPAGLQSTRVDVVEPVASR
jgi:hypothetical protein